MVLGLCAGCARERERIRDHYTAALKLIPCILVELLVCLPLSGSTHQPPAKLCTGLPFRQLLYLSHWNYLLNTEAGWMGLRRHLLCEQDRWGNNSLNNLFFFFFFLSLQIICLHCVQMCSASI